MSGEQNNKQRVRFSSTGFYIELWDACMSYQQGKCAICSCTLTLSFGPLTCACADHDHTDKLPRGILCASCNMCLGHYESHQRPHGLILAPYEAYLAAWPTRQFTRPQRAQRKRKTAPVRTMPLTIKEWRTKNT